MYSDMCFLKTHFNQSYALDFVYNVSPDILQLTKFYFHDTLEAKPPLNPVIDKWK